MYRRGPRIDRFICGEKNLRPLDGAAKIARLGDKVVQTSLAGGLSAPMVHSFVVAVGLQPVRYWNEGTASEDSVGHTSGDVVNDVGRASIASRLPDIKSDRVGFEGTDGFVAYLPRAAVIQSDFLVLKNMISGAWADAPSERGHFQLPTVPQDLLSLVSSYFDKSLDVATLSSVQLAQLAKVGSRLGSDVVTQRALSEMAIRNAQVFFKKALSKTFAKDLRRTHWWSLLNFSAALK